MSGDLITICKDELAEVVRKAVREELYAIGLRADDANQVDAARRDFMFMRRIRTFTESLAQKIALAVAVAIVGSAITLLTLGFKSWVERGGGH
jgi:hypothetical protein